MLKPQPVNYMCKIDYQQTACPICKTRGNYIKQELDLVCAVCGAIIETPYRYTAGFKFNNNIDFKIKKIQRDELKNE